MKKYIILLLALACVMGNFSYSQQISIDDSYTAQQLIQNNFGLGCVQVSNISSQVNGQVDGFNSFGYFDGSGTNFPFQNGIVLSTGKAVSGANGLNNAVLSDGNTNWNTDPDLEAALGISGTLNATSIEFDFISISNQIQFNYIFASEEYNPPYECGFTDSFAFLITEAGSGNPYTNIAVVPGTSTPVNSTNVHSDLSPYCAAQNASYFDGYNLGETNFNGQTTVMAATANIIPNVTYHVKLVIADQDYWDYDSAVFIEGNSFNATVDLGDDVTTCASSLVLNGDVGNATAIYSWYRDGNLMNGQVSPTLNVTQSGTYHVVVQIPLGNSYCQIEDSVDISLSSTQTATPLSDYQVCDANGNGIETFDLSTKDAEVIASVPPSNYNISYHYTDVEAQNDLNPILVPIQNTSNPQPIYVRIEDVDNGCLAFSSFNLVVNPLPNPSTPTDLEVCDDANQDGITQINLTQKDAEISSGQGNVVVSYHLTQSDADAGSNPIISPYTNTNQTEQLFVRVTNISSGCYGTTTLTVKVLNTPVINPGPFYLDACDQDHDGWATFDLTSITNDVIGGLSGVTVSFYLDANDADLGTNPIPNPMSYDNTIINEQTVYVRVEDDNTGCATIAPVEIHTNLLLTYTSIINFSLCDIDNDGVQEFDLNGIADVIRNDLPNVVITFYHSQSDRDNGVNPIDTGQLYTPSSSPETLYITLTSATCSEVADFDLLLNTVPSFNSIGTTTYCDDDQDGFTMIDLSSFDSAVTYGNASNYNITYFLSQSDANSYVNPLPTNYANISNPQTFYARIGDNNTGCAGITSFEISVIPAPVTSTPTDVTVCESNPNGMTTIDLTSKIPEVVTNTTGLNISFHTSLADADANTNAIANPSNYSSGSQTFFIRVENSSTGCYRVESFNLTVNTLPVFEPISNFRICENNSDGVADFIFATKDNEILHGQGGKQVLYFASQTDADNRVNIINKNSQYQNVSNPQTIYVRVENLSDPDCYGTSSFSIEVGTNPAYNEPSDWFVCDDIANDGSETFDLNEKIVEVTQGINEPLDVSFYASLSDAQTQTNPLPLQFQNTVNPQEVFVSISNGTICNSITSFVINVIPAPDVNESEPLQLCDTDYDGFATFNLTDAEVNILDVRQNNIVVEYFENMTDLENQVNQITNTQAYTNTTNPQTVYVRITNTISNCYLSIDLNLIVNFPPVINPFGSVEICDNPNSYFDLTQVNSLVVNDQNNMAITYYTSASDAQNGTNAISTDYTYQTNNDTIYTRVENNTTGCATTYAFQLRVNTQPVANQPPDLESCDDDYDGYFTFDLAQQDTWVLGGQNPNNFTVSYYNSLASAENGSNALTTMYAAVDQETIYARVENNATGCYNTSNFTTIVHPKPVLNIGDQVICLDNVPLIVSANTNNPNDQYLWPTNETTPEINISTVGTYWVTVTSQYGCETTEVFNVTESELATINTTETVDFSNPNNITITISGIGDYQYELDHGAPQDSNVFENVTLGYHTVTIIDLNGCSETSKEVVVVDAPKFMTPNNDGYFDTWHIAGVETLPGTIVYIYDRYGKLLKELTWNSPGWNGTFNGAPMPASDYWYLADVKKGDIEFKVKGHFALKR